MKAQNIFFNPYHLLILALNMLTNKWNIINKQILNNPYLFIKWWGKADDESFLKGVKACKRMFRNDSDYETWLYSNLDIHKNLNNKNFINI